MQRVFVGCRVWLEALHLLDADDLLEVVGDARMGQLGGDTGGRAIGERDQTIAGSAQPIEGGGYVGMRRK
jgi:hypothetical protein